jgi:hypothetical protein
MFTSRDDTKTVAERVIAKAMTKDKTMSKVIHAIGTMIVTATFLLSAAAAPSAAINGEVRAMIIASASASFCCDA